MSPKSGHNCGTERVKNASKRVFQRAVYRTTIGVKLLPFVFLFCSEIISADWSFLRHRFLESNNRGDRWIA